MSTETGKWTSKETSIGPYGDSFYEYLLKLWVYRGGNNLTTFDADGRHRYDRTMSAVRDKLHHRSPDSNQFLYVADFSKNKVAHQMWHLTCFIGGLYALSAHVSYLLLLSCYLLLVAFIVVVVVVVVHIFLLLLLLFFFFLVSISVYIVICFFSGCQFPSQEYSQTFVDFSFFFY